MSDFTFERNDNTVEGFASNLAKTAFTKTSVTNDLIPQLPNGFYRLHLTQKDELIYISCKVPDLPSKVYGDLTEDRERIIHTFKSRKSSTGVLLSGLKGSGKTLQAKLIIHELSLTMPVIIVDEFIHPSVIKLAVAQLGMCCIFVDEFEKLYPMSGKDQDDKQIGFLSLLDGMGVGKALYLLTVNQVYVNDNLMNRPGRIFYHKEYNCLSFNFISSYLRDTLKNKDIVADLTARLFFSEASFDIVQAVAEELNRYPGLGMEGLQLMNISAGTYRASFLWRPKPDMRPVSLCSKPLSDLMWQWFQIEDSLPKSKRESYLNAVNGAKLLMFNLHEDKVTYSEHGCILSNGFGELIISRDESTQLKLFSNKVYGAPDRWTRKDVLNETYNQPKKKRARKSSVIASLEE